jgi:hypothetical protein
MQRRYFKFTNCPDAEATMSQLTDAINSLYGIVGVARASLRTVAVKGMTVVVEAGDGEVVKGAASMEGMAFEESSILLNLV